MSKSSNKSDGIKVNGISSDNPTEMAKALNNFFSSVGTDKSNSIPVTNTHLLSYVSNEDNLTLLNLGNTSQVHGCNIIKSMLTKIVRSGRYYCKLN
jgi:hypothetical protein